MIDLNDVLKNYSKCNGSQSNTEVTIINAKKLGVYLINGTFVLINPTEIKALIPINDGQCTIELQSVGYDVDQNLDFLVEFLAENDLIYP